MGAKAKTLADAVDRVAKAKAALVPVSTRRKSRRQNSANGAMCSTLDPAGR